PAARALLGRSGALREKCVTLPRRRATADRTRLRTQRTSGLFIRRQRAGGTIRAEIGRTTDHPARRSRNRSANGAQVDSPGPCPGQSPGSSLQNATSPERATQLRRAHLPCLAPSGLNLVGKRLTSLRSALGYRLARRWR